MRGGPMRHSAGYGHPPGAWRGRGGAPMSPRSGPTDRRQGNDRNRSGGGHRTSGGWNAVGLVLHSLLSKNLKIRKGVIN